MIKNLIAAILSAFSVSAPSSFEHRAIDKYGGEPEVISALDAWLDVLEERGVRIHKQLNAPATETQIDEFEKAVGHSLPPEARALYSFANGQKSPFKVTYRAPAAPNIIELPFPLGKGETVGNLFGGYEFLTLEKAAKNWSGWAEIRDSSKPEELALDFDGSVSVREGDGVLKRYTHPAWIPFAEDGGGNAYALDLAPAEGGTTGQVIVIGPDEDFRRVLAPSLAAFFREAASRPLDLDEGDDQRIFFDMEDR